MLNTAVWCKVGILVDQQLKQKWTLLSAELQALWSECFSGLKLSFQQQNRLLDIFLDIDAWEEQSSLKPWPQEWQERYQGKRLGQQVVNFYHQTYEQLAEKEKEYRPQHIEIERGALKFGTIGEEEQVLGRCPVASERTRCCNLLTLDVVRSCGMDCTYCSIQSFFNDDQVDIEVNLSKKLSALELDPTQRYHIGTGQSSDSLLWGNRAGILDDLMEFARHHPNVILELKTKSHNVNYLLQNQIPANVLVTWSLNPQSVIDIEERLTSSLAQRLEAARLVAKQGILVGFHFHPMIYFKNYRQEYAHIVDYLVEHFNSDQVALVSLGTVTFTKKVIKQIRHRAIKTKILQMKLVDAEGKLSYPLSIKEEMFRSLYEMFRPWQQKVFFYMCMEDQSLWKKVFGYEYHSNEEFERDMIAHYFSKISALP